MHITTDIKYIGVNDHKVDLFEGQYPVPNGMAYNSYAIMDEKIAIMDTVDANFTEEWLGNIEAALEGRKPDYLVVQHMEPDHSANIANFLSKYPEAVVVSSAKAFVMMKNFFGDDYASRRIVVGEGDTLTLGKHTLTFVTAPMVHWPEVIVSYDSCDKVLFSADGFGKFGALDAQEDWACEARRYYIGIVGKYGVQVQSLLKKAAGLDIAVICPLHGPVLSENLGVSAVEITKRLFKEGGYNCCQAVVLTYADVVELDPTLAATIAAPFGGGMGRLREVCGAVSGMTMVAGFLSPCPTADDPVAKKANYTLVQNFAEKFRAQNGAIVCRTLLGLDRTKDDPTPSPRTAEYYKKRPCAEYVYDAALIVGEYLQNK